MKRSLRLNFLERFLFINKDFPFPDVLISWLRCVRDDSYNIKCIYHFRADLRNVGVKIALIVKILVIESDSVFERLWKSHVLYQLNTFFLHIDAPKSFYVSWTALFRISSNTNWINCLNHSTLSYTYLIRRSMIRS